MTFNKKVIKDEEGYFILLKGKINQDEHSILNINTPNARTPTFVKERLLKVKAYIETCVIIMGDFHTGTATNGQFMEIEIKEKHSETNRSYEPNGFNRYLENISP